MKAKSPKFTNENDNIYNINATKMEVKNSEIITLNGNHQYLFDSLNQ